MLPSLPLLLPLLAKLPAHAAAPGCATAADCSLCGRCQAGRCACLPGWTGPRCASLKQAESYRIWPPGGAAAQARSSVAASWGAGLVPPVPGISSRFHLWVDSLCLTDPTNASAQLGCSHTKNALIVHASAENVSGPYVFEDVAVQPSANNPAAVYDPVAKLYLLFFLDMGSPMVPPVPSWSNQCTGARNGSIPRHATLLPPAPAALPAVPCTGAGTCERVAIQYSRHPAGPWRKMIPKLSAADPPGGGGRQSVIANPSPLVLANGSVMMVYRYNPPSGKPAGETLAVALAQSWDAPYELIADNITNRAVTPGRFLAEDTPSGRKVWFTQGVGGAEGDKKWLVNCSAPCAGSNSWSGSNACRHATPVSSTLIRKFAAQGAFACYQAAEGDMRAEDPWLFKNELGYHIVFHQYNQSDTVTGGHLFSPDGRSWRACSEAAWDVSMRYANGTTKRVDHRERPTLLTAEDGTPTWLITGVEVGSKSGSFPDCWSETALTKIAP